MCYVYISRGVSSSSSQTKESHGIVSPTERIFSHTRVPVGSNVYFVRMWCLVGVHQDFAHSFLPQKAVFIKLSVPTSKS